MARHRRRVRALDDRRVRGARAAGDVPAPREPRGDAERRRAECDHPPGDTSPCAHRGRIPQRGRIRCFRLRKRRGRSHLRSDDAGRRGFRTHAPPRSSALGDARERAHRPGGHGRRSYLPLAAADTRVPHRHGVLQHVLRHIVGCPLSRVREGRARRRAGGVGADVGERWAWGALSACSSRRA